MVVVADDDPATAQRIVAVARIARADRRASWCGRAIQADAAALEREGADRVIADELESVVQLFAEVLRNYRIPPQQIEAHEQTIRSGGYAALRAPWDGAGGRLRCGRRLPRHAHGRGPGRCAARRSIARTRSTSIGDLEVTAVDRDRRRSTSMAQPRGFNPATS